ncbi:MULTISPECIES: HNH endonuclease [Paenibacillus]|uniref:HNH endonuclease n=1 Tax=Paenibacillus TaxID=44249 RepID=UPI0021164E27|nr:HNH endonuclease [Paenibacillus odorifer]
MLYYFTACDKNARKHYEDTVAKPYLIAPLLEKIDPVVQNELMTQGLDQHVHMWGAVPGPSNKKRWSNLKVGDGVLVYVKEGFRSYAKVVAKTINREVAEYIWGTDNEDRTWEYIYFLKEVKSVNFSKEMFSSFFGYKTNFIPQGFSNIEETKFQIRMKKYPNVDALVNDLNNNFLMSDEDLEDGDYQNSLETDFRKVEDKPEVPKKKKKQRILNGVKVWDRDPKVAQRAIKKALFQCEFDINHSTFISSVSKENYVEAHHLIPMKFQNDFENVSLDTESNILALCPNCHRMIHHSRPKEKKLLLKEFYEKRKDQLHNLGIEFSLVNLNNFYGMK